MLPACCAGHLGVLGERAAVWRQLKRISAAPCIRLIPGYPARFGTATTMCDGGVADVGRGLGSGVDRWYAVVRCVVFCVSVFACEGEG